MPISFEAMADQKTTVKKKVMYIYTYCFQQLNMFIIYAVTMFYRYAGKSSVKNNSKSKAQGTHIIHCLKSAIYFL